MQLRIVKTYAWIIATANSRPKRITKTTKGTTCANNNNPPLPIIAHANPAITLSKVWPAIILAKRRTAKLRGLNMYETSQKWIWPKISGYKKFSQFKIRKNFNFQFTTILFLLFDIETVFLFPWAASLSQLPAIGYWSQKPYLKPPQVDGWRTLRLWDNLVEGTRQNDSVTSE